MRRTARRRSRSWSGRTSTVTCDALTENALGIAKCAATLSGGSDLLTFAVVDSSCLTTQATTPFVVVDPPEPPELAIVHPANGESGIEREIGELVATVADAHDAPEALVGRVRSYADGILCDLTVDAVGGASCGAVLLAASPAADDSGDLIRLGESRVVTPRRDCGSLRYAQVERLFSCDQRLARLVQDAVGDRVAHGLRELLAVGDQAVAARFLFGRALDEPVHDDLTARARAPRA